MTTNYPSHWLARPPSWLAVAWSDTKEPKKGYFRGFLTYLGSSTFLGRGSICHMSSKPLHIQLNLPRMLDLDPDESPMTLNTISCDPNSRTQLGNTELFAYSAHLETGAANLTTAPLQEDMEATEDCYMYSYSGKPKIYGGTPKIFGGTPGNQRIFNRTRVTFRHCLKTQPPLCLFKPLRDVDGSGDKCPSLNGAPIECGKKKKKLAYVVLEDIGKNCNSFVAAFRLADQHAWLNSFNNKTDKQKRHKASKKSPHKSTDAPRAAT